MSATQHTTLNEVIVLEAQPDGTYAAPTGTQHTQPSLRWHIQPSAPAPAPAASGDGWEQVRRYLTSVAMMVGLVLGVALLALSARQALTSDPDIVVPPDITEKVGQVASTSV